jgi:hypothetical protein
MTVLLLVALATAGCSDSDDASPESVASSTTAAPVAALPVDETLRDALGDVVALEALDGREAARLFDATTLPLGESVFDAYWAGAGDFGGAPVALAAMQIAEADDPRIQQRLEVAFSARSSSRRVGDASVFLDPTQRQLFWVAPPVVIIVAADDGETALAVAEELLAP